MTVLVQRLGPSEKRDFFPAEVFFQLTRLLMGDPIRWLSRRGGSFYSFFSSNNQIATDNAEGSVILHPSYLVWLESLGGQWTVDDVGEFPSGSL